MTSSAKRLRNYSVKNMIYSLVAVFALAFAWWALMPSPESLMRRPVEVRPVASYAAEQASWPVWLPEGLGDGEWTPTTVNYQTRADVPTWRMGWVTPSQEWIGLDQARAVTPEWRELVLPDAEQVGEVTLAVPGGGEGTWTQWRSETETALIFEPPAGDTVNGTTVVHGTTSVDELEEFVSSLRVMGDPENG